MVRIRLFAAAREAAGTAELEVPPGRLPELLAALRARHGARFSQVLSISSVLVDGDAVDKNADVAVPDGAEVAILPPVSGGAGAPGAGSGNPPPGLTPVPLPGPDGPERTAALPSLFTPTVLLYGWFAATGLVAMVVGSALMSLVVLAAAAVVLADLAVLIDRGIARPVLPVAVLPGLLLPTAIAFGAPASWESAGTWFAAAFLTLFAFLLLSGRRWGVVDVAGMTLLPMLVVGLGASALLLLRARPDGLRFTAVLVAMVLAADAAGILARVTAAPSPFARAAPLLGSLLVGIVATVVPGGIALVVLAVLVATTAGASVAGARLVAELRHEGRLPVRSTPLPLFVVGQGTVTAALDALLLSAPVAFLVAGS